MNRGDRVEAPLVRGERGLVASDWDVALDRFAALLEGAAGRIVLLASGRASTESLGLVRRLLDRAGGLTAAIRVPLGDEAPLAGVPNLALRRERIPNLHGAELVGYGTDWEGALRAAAGASLVVVLDAELDEREQAALAAAAAPVVVLGTVHDDLTDAAALVLPITTVVEENGTFVNRDLRVQRFQQAKTGRGMARPAWWVAGEVLAGRGPDADAPATADEAFELLGRSYPAFAGLTHADLGYTGRVLEGAAAGAAGGAR
jgi:predicted molibdopterin-dependent oxidoreductase YjgC